MTTEDTRVELLEALAELVERYQRHPQKLNSLIYMGKQGGERYWREGDMEGAL